MLRFSTHHLLLSANAFRVNGTESAMTNRPYLVVHKFVDETFVHQPHIYVESNALVLFNNAVPKIPNVIKYSRSRNMRMNE